MGGGVGMSWGESTSLKGSMTTSELSKAARESTFNDSPEQCSSVSKGLYIATQTGRRQNGRDTETPIIKINPKKLKEHFVASKETMIHVVPRGLSLAKQPNQTSRRGSLAPQKTSSRSSRVILITTRCPQVYTTMTTLSVIAYELIDVRHPALPLPTPSLESVRGFQRGRPDGRRWS